MVFLLMAAGNAAAIDAPDMRHFDYADKLDNCE
jgi:hypothetical protein